MPELNKKLKAFIVEDDPDLIHIFSRALELSGYDTQTVSDGAEALALLTETVPDIVVLDLHLPGMFGGDILHSIRADGRFINTKVILATADYHTAQELRAQADLVLLKPISFKQLRAMSDRLNKIQKTTVPPVNVHPN